jgi:predicted exporter
LAVALWAAGLALCLWQVSQARFVADLSLFLPAAPTAEQRLIVELLRDGAASRVMLIAIEGADAPTRARLARALGRTWDGPGTDPGPSQVRPRSPFSAIANGATGGFGRERELLLAHRYALSPAVGAQRFTVEGLRAAIGETVDLLASPAGALVKPYVTRDPTGELLAILEGLRPARAPQTVEGVWASPDGERALLLARTHASGSDTDAQAKAVEAVEAAFREAVARDPQAARPGQEARLLLTGPGVFAVRSRALVRHDVERLAALSLAAVVALLLAVYRSPTALALGLVPVATGALAGIAAVSLGFGTVHGITLGFGTALIGEAVDYAIYLFVQAERGPAADAEWVARFWPTIRLGVLTSIAGFSAMLFSGLPGLAQLGLYAITGVVVAALVTRHVLPALLPRAFRIRDVSALGERLDAGAALLARARHAVPAIALAALVVALVAASRDTLWDRELASLNPISARDRAIDTELRAALGASDARHMVAVRGASADEALAAAEAAGRKLDPLVVAGRLGGYESPARFLPSAATQRARLESLPETRDLRTRLEAALVDSPLRPERLAPFVAEVERARTAPLLTREQVAGTALGAALDGLLWVDGAGRWTALLGLRAPAGANAPDSAAVRAAFAGDPNALVIDLKGELDRLYGGYFDRALHACAAGLAVILALLFATLRSARRVGRVLIPLAAGVLAVVAFQVLAGTRLSLMHLVGLLLVFAIGSNYALFFERMASDPASAGPRTLASLALANLTTVAAFGMLAFSSVPVLNAIGSTVALGALATLLFAAMQGGAAGGHAIESRHPRTV